MRSPVFRFVLVLGVLTAGSAAGEASKAAQGAPSLTLYEKADFAGRHVTFHAASDAALKDFTAHSARSAGLWTLCEGREPTSRCQTVNGPMAGLKVQPVIVRPGVDAVALYEEPGLKGRRAIYSFASDMPPPFRARSARAWGGPWSLCDAASDRCQVVEGERPQAIEFQVAEVRPGRAPQGHQLEAAAPPRLTLSLAEPHTPALPAPEASPEPRLEAAAPPPAAASDAAQAPASAVVAEAAPPRATTSQSPYVEIPLPPRPPQTELPRQAPPAPPAADASAVRAPAPAPVERVRRVAYACADGLGLTVLFDDRDGTAMVLARGQDPIALRRTDTRARGGFFYEGADHVLFGAGVRAGYAAEGAEPVDCYAGEGARRLSYRDRPRPSRFDTEAQRGFADVGVGPDPEPAGPQ